MGQEVFEGEKSFLWLTVLKDTVPPVGETTAGGQVVTVQL